jgi:hypothetical protein
LPPTILIALASPSADQGIVQEVLDDANTGARQSVADVKARLAKAKDAQRKAHANQKKSPEQMKKEQAAKKRQENLDRAHEEKWAAIKAREVEAVGKAARLLVARFGAGGTLELFTIMRGAAFHQVEKMFLLHPNAVMDHTFLTEQDVEAKFGGTL